MISLSFGDGYGSPLPKMELVIHPGVDYQGPAKTPVSAIRGGFVHAVRDEGQRDARVVIRVQVGGTKEKPVYEYDTYVHVEPLVEENPDDPPRVGTGEVIARIAVADFPEGSQHVHVMTSPKYDEKEAYSDIKTSTNPLGLMLADEEIDPGVPEQRNPKLFHANDDGYAVSYVRRGGKVQIDIENHSLFDEIVIRAELQDLMNYTVGCAPLTSGYWIEKKKGTGRNVQSQRSPYILTNWRLFGGVCSF